MLIKVTKNKLRHLVCDSIDKTKYVNDRRIQEKNDEYIYNLSTLKEIDTGFYYIFIEDRGDAYEYEYLLGKKTLYHGEWVQVESLKPYENVKYMCYESELEKYTNKNRKANKTPKFHDGDKLVDLNSYSVYIFSVAQDKWLPNQFVEGGGGSGASGGVSGASTADKVSYVNTTISSNNVRQALDKIVSKLYYVKPSISSFTCTPNAGVYEIGTGKIPSIKFTWAYNKDITTQSLSGCTLANNTIREYTYNTELNSTKSFTLTANDGENTVTATKTFTFVYPTYYGVLDNNTITSSNITSKCTKLVRDKNEYKGLYTTNKQSVVFASPWAVKSIINQNNYEVISSFNLDRITINGYSYYVYSLPNVTITNFAYTFKY